MTGGTEKFETDTHMAVLRVKSQAQPLVSRLLDLAKGLCLGLPRQPRVHATAAVEIRIWLFTHLCSKKVAVHPGRKKLKSELERGCAERGGARSEVYVGGICGESRIVSCL